MLKKFFKRRYFIRLRFKEAKDNAFVYRVTGNFPVPEYLKQVLAIELDKFLHYNNGQNEVKSS